MEKNRSVVKKLVWAGIISWIIFCIGKGIYEEMKMFGEETVGIDCIAAPGSSVVIGPYKWTALEVKDGYPIQRLTRDGKVLIEGSLKLAAKYPWLLGDCAAPIADKLSPELKNAGVKSMHPLRSDVEYLFVIDVRTDKIHYFTRDQRQLIEEKFGLKSEFGEFYYLEGLLFARSAKEERRKLAAALRPPTDGQSASALK